MAPSVAPASSTGPGKLMMIGWATPTVEPLTGAILGGPNGAVPVNGVGSCPPAGPATTGTASGSGAGGNPGAGGATTPGSPGAGSGSPNAGPALSTSTQPNIEATPAAFRAAKRLPLVQPDICIPPVTFWKQCRIAPRPAICSAPAAVRNHLIDPSTVVLRQGEGRGGYARTADDCASRGGVGSVRAARGVCRNRQFLDAARACIHAGVREPSTTVMHLRI